MKKLMTLLVGLMMLACSAVTASALPITYQLTGSLSGDYNGTPFTDSAFTLTVAADTSDVVAVSWFGTNDLYGAGNYPLVFTGPNLGGSLAISGIGTFAFANRLWVLAAQADSLYPGVFGIGTDVEDVFIEVLDSFFETYHLDTAVAVLPVTLWQTGAVPFSVSESGGTSGELILTGASSLTFQAEGGVPEPSTFVLVGAGLAGLAYARRKRTI